MISNDHYIDNECQVPLATLKMHPAVNYRQSRRSACDRCRGFKLRCERDPVRGRSCERCLKAQVQCTTSVGQPVPSYLSSRAVSGSFPRDCDGRILESERMAMPVLHKSSTSRVRKPLGSSRVSRSHENQRFSYWSSSSSLPCSTIESMAPVTEYIGTEMPFDPVSTYAFEQWRDQCPSWNPDSYHLVSSLLFYRLK